MTKMSARRGYDGKNLNKESLVEGEAKEGKGFGARRRLARELNSSVATKGAP